MWRAAPRRAAPRLSCLGWLSRVVGEGRFPPLARASLCTNERLQPLKLGIAAMRCSSAPSLSARLPQLTLLLLLASSAAQLGGASSCGDGVRNGAETAVDCGGDQCASCGTGAACFVPGDCASALCANSAASASPTCAAPSCADGEANGGESDVDCGAACAAAGGGGLCGEGAACVSNADCASGSCLLVAEPPAAGGRPQLYCARAGAISSGTLATTRLTVALALAGRGRGAVSPAALRAALATLLDLPAEALRVAAAADVPRPAEWGAGAYAGVAASVAAAGWPPSIQPPPAWPRYALGAQALAVAAHVRLSLLVTPAEASLMLARLAHLPAGAPGGELAVAASGGWEAERAMARAAEAAAWLAGFCGAANGSIVVGVDCRGVTAAPPPLPPRVTLSALVGAAVSVLAPPAVDVQHAPPSPLLEPAALLILVQPLGAAALPLVSRRAFPTQPRLRLVDRHDRAVGATVAPLRVLASLLVLAAADQPRLLGDTSAALATDGGVAYTALLVSANASTAQVNFAVSWLAPAADGAPLPAIAVLSAPFAVPDAPVPLVPVVARVPFSPIAVAALSAVGLVAAVAAVWVALRRRRIRLAGVRVHPNHKPAEVPVPPPEDLCVVYDVRGVELARGRMMALQDSIAASAPPAGFFIAPAVAPPALVAKLARRAAAAAAASQHEEVTAATPVDGHGGSGGGSDAGDPAIAAVLLDDPCAVAGKAASDIAAAGTAEAAARLLRQPLDVGIVTRSLAVFNADGVPLCSPAPAATSAGAGVGASTVIVALPRSAAAGLVGTVAVPVHALPPTLTRARSRTRAPAAHALALVGARLASVDEEEACS